MVKVAGIVGSINKHSMSRKFLEAAAGHFSETVAFNEIRIDEIPLFSVDTEFPTPDSVKHLRDALADSDAIVIVAPEYNLSYSAALKNVIDWLSRPVIAGDPKPALAFPILVLSTSAGMSGGMVGQEQVRSVLSYLGADVMPQPRASFAGIYNMLDENGNLALDAMSAGFLESTVKAFEQYIAK